MFYFQHICTLTVYDLSFASFCKDFSGLAGMMYSTTLSMVAAVLLDYGVNFSFPVNGEFAKISATLLNIKTPTCPCYFHNKMD